MSQVLIFNPTHFELQAILRKLHWPTTNDIEDCKVKGTQNIFSAPGFEISVYFPLQTTVLEL